MIKVIGISKISPSGQVKVPKEIIDFLNVVPGDEILFKLKNDNVNIVKYQGVEEENYLSSSSMGKGIVYIPRDVRNALNVDLRDDILWIIDENNNIILRDIVLPPYCLREAINKDLSGIIISIGHIAPSQQITIPMEIGDLLDFEIGDTVYYGLDENGNVIVDNRESSHPLSTSTIFSNFLTHLANKLLNIIDVDVPNYLLWVVDDDGNIIIRNNVLPDVCLLY